MKKHLLTFLAILWASSSVAQSFTLVSGKIVDSYSKLPIAFVNVFIEHSNIGTVSNSEGMYALQVPSDLLGSTVKISCIGYMSNSILASDLKNSKGGIELEPRGYELNDVVVTPQDPVDIVKQAFGKINSNYSQVPLGMKVFYREHILEDDKTVGLSEALLGAYLSPYNQKKSQLQIELLKGRKTIDTTASKSLNYWYVDGVPPIAF